LSKSVRAQIVAAHDIVSVSLRAETPEHRAIHPTAFDRRTLEWVFRSVDYCSIWSAKFPEGVQAHRAAGFKAVEDGARFTATVETTPEGAADWLEIVARLKRPTAKVAVFGPDVAGGRAQ
jgi:hypothetical protein